MAPGNPIYSTHGISLPSRYEIRQVTPEMSDWISALMWHGHFFRSPIWTEVHAGELAKQLLRLHRGQKKQYSQPDMIMANGLSYCIWDSQYVYKRAGSEAAGGALYWDDIDPDDPELVDDDAARQRLLDAMDFPVVSFAVSRDKHKLFEGNRALLPLQFARRSYMDEHDRRSKGSWEPTGPGQVVQRCGTGTRGKYGGQGLMRGLARFVMLEMKVRGFRAIQILCEVPSVYQVWMNPPKPFKSTTVSILYTWEYEMEDAEGRKVKPFAKCKLDKTWLVWTELGSQGSRSSEESLFLHE